MNMHVSFAESLDTRTLNIEDECHVIVLIPKTVRDNDKALFTSKWFDYRFMTPFEATMEYMRAFETIGRRIYRRELDLNRSQHIQFLTPERLKRILEEGKMTTALKSKLTGFWRGRQVADALGMPYEDYLEQAITLRMRAWQRTYLPRPEQLYDMVMVEKIQAKWEELKAATVYLPKHHAFLSQNYGDLPVQNDFHEFLFQQASAGGDRFFQLARFVEENFLPYEKLRSRLTEEELERVSEHL